MPHLSDDLREKNKCCVAYINWRMEVVFKHTYIKVAGSDPYYLFTTFKFQSHRAFHNSELGALLHLFSNEKFSWFLNHKSFTIFIHKIIIFSHEVFILMSTFSLLPPPYHIDSHLKIALILPYQRRPFAHILNFIFYAVVCINPH